jgi:hypothetical protein
MIYTKPDFEKLGFSFEKDLLKRKLTGIYRGSN